MGSSSIIYNWYTIIVFSLCDLSTVSLSSGPLLIFLYFVQAMACMVEAMVVMVGIEWAWTDLAVLWTNQEQAPLLGKLKRQVEQHFNQLNQLSMHLDLLPWCLNPHTSSCVIHFLLFWVWQIILVDFKLIWLVHLELLLCLRP